MAPEGVSRGRTVAPAPWAAETRGKVRVRAPPAPCSPIRASKRVESGDFRVQSDQSSRRSRLQVLDAWTSAPELEICCAVYRTGGSTTRHPVGGALDLGRLAREHLTTHSSYCGPMVRVPMMLARWVPAHACGLRHVRPKEKPPPLGRGLELTAAAISLASGGGQTPGPRARAPAARATPVPVTASAQARRPCCRTTAPRS